MPADRTDVRPRAPRVEVSEPGLLRPLAAPLGATPSVCPHCWMVNPGAFQLCARCGASMETFLQESGGLRRTAPVQSPVPVHGRLSLPQRVVVGLFLIVLALSYLVQLLPVRSGPHAPRSPATALP